MQTPRVWHRALPIKQLRYNNTPYITTRRQVALASVRAMGRAKSGGWLRLKTLSSGFTEAIAALNPDWCGSNLIIVSQDPITIQTRIKSPRRTLRIYWDTSTRQ